MNSEPSDEQQRADKRLQPEAAELPVSDGSQPVDVPVFSCIVFVCADTDGGVRARVANLPGIQFTASSEREALAKIVPAFKQRIAELLQNETSIPWIEPPAPIEAGEQQRFIPVHL
jgi:hypothetical protein